METVLELYHHMRDKFPHISQSADRQFIKLWGAEFDRGFEYTWFQALAYALNAEMRSEVPYASHAPIFQFIEGAFAQGSLPVKDCIDVSFVENLFRQVPSKKCAEYWTQIPPTLKWLYTEFHHRDP